MSHRTLGNFETRLLAELRQTVAAAPAPATPAPGSPPRRRRVALAAAGGGVLAAGIVIGVPVLGGERAPTAYAVRTNDDGTVTVSIARWEDADGLERQLEANGVAAEVNYLPPGKACRWPRFEQPVTPRGPWAVRKSDSGGVSFTLEPADYTGMTLVITHADLDASHEADSSLGIAVASGPVQPCELVNAADSGDPYLDPTTPSSPAAPPSR